METFFSPLLDHSKTMASFPFSLPGWSDLRPGEGSVIGDGVRFSFIYKAPAFRQRPSSSSGLTIASQLLPSFNLKGGLSLGEPTAPVQAGPPHSQRVWAGGPIFIGLGLAGLWLPVCSFSTQAVHPLKAQLKRSPIVLPGSPALRSALV